MSSKSRNELKTELCNILVRTGAIKFGLFTLSSGKLSPYYIDLRIVPSFPEAFRKIIEIYELETRDAIGLNSFNRIAGIPTAGVPFATALCYALSKPFLYVRKGEKTYGRERRVEGILNPGEKILIVDDLTTTGKNIIEAVEAVKAEGGLAEKSLVLIDRQEGGVENLRKIGVKLHAFMKISEVAKRLSEMGVIEKQQYEQIVKQFK